MLIELNDKNFEEEIKTGLKIVEFYTTWCGYCQKQKIELMGMDKVKIGQVDADKEAELAKKFSVSVFPTFIIFKDGEKKEQFSGFIKKEDLMQRILNYIK